MLPQAEETLNVSHRVSPVNDTTTRCPTERAAWNVAGSHQKQPFLGEAAPLPNPYRVRDS
jgi:hypothetical protein